MNIAILAGSLNALVGVFLIILTTKLVLRTEKQLDMVAKFFLAASVTFLMATLLEINAYVGLYAPDASFAFSKVMFTITTILFASGGYVLYGITKGNQK
jgi:ABC-type Co2+ transport system permease subunit